jgi:hypothetical protein
MKSSHFRWAYGALLLSLAFIFATEPAVAQQTAASEAEQLKARIDAAVLELGNNPRFKSLSAKDRQGLVEFVAGNMLFVLLHELGHAAVAEMGIIVLGKDEDAADSFAATRLIRLGGAFSDQVVADSAKGWFMSDRRGKKEGDTVPYYDAHGLDLQRAYQFVCYLVGSDPNKFKSLADETKLPPDRQQSCKGDYSKALKSWDAALEPHRRAPDQPKTNIDVTYGDGGKDKQLDLIAKVSREIRLLEPVAQLSAESFVWPTPFALEMQACGFVNAAWVAETHKLTLCYELAADFADLYREYGIVQAKNGKKRKSK